MAQSAAQFTPFPEPKASGDLPLVRHTGAIYACNGCGGPVPDGAWLYERIEDGMVTGLLARSGPDGPIVHACGSAAEPGEPDDGAEVT
jgi:hypothetical protein